jgi:hypothetical protein
MKTIREMLISRVGIPRFQRGKFLEFPEIFCPVRSHAAQYVGEDIAIIWYY